MSFDGFAAIAAALAGPTPDADRVSAALAEVARVRRELDRAERDLIAAARQADLSWPSIAAALGLRSRQAAEQRFLRLTGVASRDPEPARAARRGQRSVDKSAGESIVELRTAVERTARVLRADPTWRADHHRADLIISTMDSALDAPPGSLYALVDKVIEDIASDPGARPSAGVTHAFDALRDAWTAAQPQ